MPEADGDWKPKVLRSFDGTDGKIISGNVILDAAGNLYGTAELGGTYNCGTVFELTPEAGGSWTHKLLHIFNCTDGSAPVGGLILDAAGNLYGTTYFGGNGTFGQGTVFEITP
jgi:uncharacterized repeat protein (TIGR03803 family)